MKIAVAGDHAGLPLKRLILEKLEQDGHQVVDLGAFDEAPSDYPDFARAIGRSVSSGETEKGRSISVISNRFPRNSNFEIAHAAAIPKTVFTGTQIAAASRVRRIEASATGSDTAAR